MAAPLDDVKVIEVDSWMATPSAGAILADLGADVIKVEPLDGDPARGFSRPAKLPPEIKDYDFQFDVDNRGKRSIAVDLGSPVGRDVVHRLIADADVFMCNLLIHRQERFGLDAATVTAMDKVPLRQRTRENMIIPTANRYPCGDGKWVVLNMPQDSAWPLLCRVIERLDWLDDERFADIRGRFAHMPEIVAGIDEALALFPTLSSPDIGDYRSVGIPMRFATADVGPRGPSPKLGDHTREVLASAGMSDSEIDGLLAHGAVRDNPGD